jgi:hypothetical protein
MPRGQDNIVSNSWAVRCGVRSGDEGEARAFADSLVWYGVLAASQPDELPQGKYKGFSGKYKLLGLRARVPTAAFAWTDPADPQFLKPTDEAE